MKKPERIQRILTEICYFSCVSNKNMNDISQDFFFSCKNCVLENPRSFYGSFALGPFRNNQSLTVANGLRRTLLTEITGIGITHAEIEGICHEYSTLSGIRESTLDLLLNLKSLVFKTFSPFKKPLFGYLDVQGPGIVRASDFKLPPSLKCVDPDQYIFTLTENGNFQGKFTFCDYATSLKILNLKFDNSEVETFEKTQLKYWQNSEKNFLLVDPLFHSILKVNYCIETLEPFQKNIPNEIIYLEIWTNGSLHPRQAFYQSFLFLKKLFFKLDSMRLLNYKFTNFFLSSETTTTKYLQNFSIDFSYYNSLNFKRKQNFIMKNEKILEKKKTNLFLSAEIEKVEKDFFQNLDQTEYEIFQNFSLQKLQLPLRLLKILERNNIHVLRELLQYSSEDLQKLPGMGKSSFFLLKNSLQKYGFPFQSLKL